MHFHLMALIYFIMYNHCNDLLIVEWVALGITHRGRVPRHQKYKY